VKFGLFYELQLPKPADRDQWGPDAERRIYHDMLEQVALADSLGFDYVFEVEHHFLEEYSHSSAPEVFLGAASQRTKNIRLGHGIVIFPGGAGTAEEILYLLGILLDPANKKLPFPVVFTGPADSADYFQQIHEFIGATLGPAAQARYRVIIDDPAGVARAMVQGMAEVRDYRRQASDSYGFNWLLKIPLEFQRPFEVTHASMRALRLSLDQPVHERAANLRRAFSGIVAGNIKEYGVNAIEQYGPFELAGDPIIMEPLDKLLRSFVAQGRMKFTGAEYKPCYRLVA